MGFRYSSVQRISKKIFRIFFPVQKSPWTAGYVKDVCEVNLVPPEKLKVFFADCIKKLQEIKGKNNMGDYLEFGVFNGSSMSSMYLTTQKLNLNSMRFFGFDAFEGLPEGTDGEHDVLKKDFMPVLLKRCKSA